MTNIPHFNDVVLSSFECPHCGSKNNELQSAGRIEDKGCKCTCIVTTKHDLNRQVVVSEHGRIVLQELDLEVPPQNKRGFLTTIEGVLLTIKDDLSKGQPQRMVHALCLLEADDHAVYLKLEAVLKQVSSYLSTDEKFTFTIDDPSGSSSIESRLCWL